MKEWESSDALTMIENLLKEEYTEEELSDERCTELAAKIVATLETAE